MMHLYQLHNKFVGFYLPPQAVPQGKEEYAEMLRRSVWLNPEDAKKNNVDECECLYIGTFDDDTGKIELVTPEVVADLAGIYTQRLKFEKGEVA